MADWGQVYSIKDYIINGEEYKLLTDNNCVSQLTDDKYPVLQNLTSIKTPMSDNYCLENVSLSKTEVIGENFANGCTKLSAVNTPNLLSVGANAFNGCVNLKEVQTNTTELSVGANAFNGCVNLKEVGHGQTLKINNGKSIPENAFSNCINLSTTIENLIEVSNIGAGAFYNCQNLNLKKVIMPDDGSKIGYGTFYNCKKLEYLKTPSAGLDDNNLVGLNNLKVLYAPNGNTYDIKNLFGNFNLEKVFIHMSFYSTMNYNQATHNFGQCLNLEEIGWCNYTSSISYYYNFTNTTYPNKLSKLTILPSSNSYTYINNGWLQGWSLSRFKELNFGSCIKIDDIEFTNSHSYLQIGSNVGYNSGSSAIENLNIYADRCYICSSTEYVKNINFYGNTLWFESGLAFASTVKVDGRFLGFYMYSMYFRFYSLQKLILGKSFQTIDFYASYNYSYSSFSPFYSNSTSFNIYIYNSDTIVNIGSIVYNNSGSYVTPTIASSCFGFKIGSIYVPSNMLDAYKSATQWRTYSARIYSLPEE